LLYQEEGHSIARAINRPPRKTKALVLSRNIYVELVVEVAALAQICYRVFRFSPVSIISSVLHTHI